MVNNQLLALLSGRNFSIARRHVCCTKFSASVYIARRGSSFGFLRKFHLTDR
jgi:hypothetical protein